MSRTIKGSFYTTSDDHAPDYCKGTMLMELDSTFDPNKPNLGKLSIEYTGVYRPPIPLPAIRIKLVPELTGEWTVRPESESFLDIVTKFMQQIGLKVTLHNLPYEQHSAMGTYVVEGFGGIFGLGRVPADNGVFEANFC